MKHTSKRLQALVLVLAMCVSFLQIPSFAATHSNETEPDLWKIGKITITDEGAVTINESCKNCGEGSVCNSVTGTIATKKNENGLLVYDKANTKFDGKLNTGYVIRTSTTDQNPVTCKDDSVITYYVTVYPTEEDADNGTKAVSRVSNKVTLEKANGKHVFAKVPTIKTAAEAEADKDHFEFVSDTATCQAAGKVTYAKKCDSCHKAIASETVAFDSAQKAHAAKMKLDKDGKETEKVDLEKEYVVPTTCGKDGAYYAVTKCKYCDAVMNRSGLKPESATGLHNYEYTVAPKVDFVAGDNELQFDDIKIEGKCSVCNAKASATDITGTLALVADKTVKPVSACQPGSKTYTLTYTAPVLVNGKLEKTKAVQEITVAYYTAGHVAGKDEHKWSENTTTDMETYKAPTCTEAGHLDQVKICSVCGAKKVVHTVTIPATGKHTAAAAKKENVVAATTKKGGSYDLVVRCADCGKVLSKKHKTTAKIVVKASKINSVKNYKGKKAKVSLKKASSVSGYQIQYGTKKNFKGAKAVKTKATTKYLTKLSKNKKYYVRVRTYKVISGKTYYSSWSGSKTVTIKK